MPTRCVGMMIDTHTMQNNIPVVIFCGGQGTRMRGGTLTKKELVEVGGRPIMWHVMRIFSAYGHNHFVLPLGYGGDQIKRYFLDYELMSRDFSLSIGGDRAVTVRGSAEHEPWRIDFIETGEHTEKASRLARVASCLDADRFFVTYGDGVGNVNIGALQQFHEQHGKLATITAIQPGNYQYGTIEADASGLVSEYAQYPPLPYWINAGFMLFERALLDEIETGDDVELETYVLQKLLARQELMMYRHHGFWQSMDTLKDALELDKRWQHDAPWKVWK